MDPLSIGLIGGGLNLLGSMFSSETSASNAQANIAAQQQMQQQSETFNAAEAQKNRDFQADQAGITRSYETQMSNTAYQRSRADMEAAGLNPILAASAGGASTPGVSTPSGSQASISAPNVSNAYSGRTSPLAGIGDAANKVVSSAIQAKTFDKMTQEIANLQTDQALTAARTVTEGTQPARVSADTALTNAQRMSTDTNRYLKEFDFPQARVNARQFEDIEKLPDWLRTSLNIGAYSGNKVSDTVAPILNSAKGVRSLFNDRFYFR